MNISIADRNRITAAIRGAESRTSGEIVCVLSHGSSGATALPFLAAAIVALALPWILVASTGMPVERILLLQILAFIVVTAALLPTRMRVALIPRAAQRAMAHRAAAEQFVIRGIARKKDRTGILIFVSLAERYARIIADDGIAAHVAQEEWQGAIDALVAHMRDGRIADGFITAIEVCGNALAKHFPHSGTGRDELPDRIYVL